MRHSYCNLWFLDTQVVQNAFKHTFNIRLLILCVKLRTDPSEEPKLRVRYFILSYSFIIFVSPRLQPCVSG